MTRTTRSQVEGIFKAFVYDIGGETTDHMEHGKYYLDYNSIYGGYLIVRINDGNTGESHPFGDTRRKAEEMWYTLHFAREVLRRTGVARAAI